MDNNTMDIVLGFLDGTDKPADLESLLKKIEF